MTLNFREFKRRYEEARANACDLCDDADCDMCEYGQNVEDAYDDYGDVCYHQEKDEKMWRK